MSGLKDIQAEIVQLVGQDVNPASPKIWQESPELAGRAIHFFASWGNALRLAGFSPVFAHPPRKTRFSGENRRIAARLFQWSVSHGPLCDSALRETDRKLYGDCLKSFDSVPAVAKRLGLPVIRDPEEEMVECAICGKKFYFIAPHLRRHDMTLDEYKEEFPGQPCMASRLIRCKTMSGELHSADEIISSLRNYAREQSPLTIDWLVDRDADLRRQAVRVFGGWEKALYAAGLKVAVRHWDKKKVLTAIKERAASFPKEEWPRIFSAAAMQRDRRSLLSAAHTHVKGWREALAAAGIEPSTILKTIWTKEMAEKELGAYAKKVGVIFQNDLLRNHRDLHAAVQRHLGPIETVVQQLGLRFGRKTRKWTIETIREELTAWVAANGPLSAQKLFETNSALHATIKRRWKSLENAAKEFDLPFECHWQVKWDRNSIADELKRLQTGGSKLTMRNVRKVKGGLVAAAIKIFGTWKKCLLAYDLPSANKVAKRSPIELKDRMTVWLKEHGPSLTVKDLIETDAPLYHAIRNRYGSFRIAAKALNFPYIYRPSKWTPELVKEKLREYAATGKPLTSTKLKDYNQPLRNISNKYFGSVREAFEAAGVVGDL